MQIITRYYVVVDSRPLGGRSVTTVVDEVNQIVLGIATAMEEQFATTTEIADNVTQASQGIQEVAQNMAKNSNVAEDVSHKIKNINTITTYISEDSSEVDINAGELSNRAKSLEAIMTKFKIA